MNPLPFVIISVCAFLWYLGGEKLAWLRDVLVPIILGISLPLLTVNNWLTRLLHFALITGGFQIVRFGYGAYDPEHDSKPSFLASLIHDRGGWWIRAIWGLIVALVAGFFPYYLHYIPLWGYVAYICLNAIIGYCVSKFKLSVLPCDLLVGTGIASLGLFLI